MHCLARRAWLCVAGLLLVASAWHVDAARADHVLDWNPVSPQVRAFEECCVFVRDTAVPAVLYPGHHTASDLASQGLVNGVGCVRLFSPSQSHGSRLVQATHGVVALLYASIDLSGAAATVTTEWDRCDRDNRLHGTARSLWIENRGHMSNLEDLPAVTAFPKSNYQGQSTQLAVGGHDLSGRIRLADTQSLQIPPGLAVYLYAQRDFKRLSWVLLHSHSDLDRIKIARRVKSIVIAPVDHVLVYPVCTFRGKPLVMGAGAYVEGFGSKYPAARSIIMPPAHTLRVFRSPTLGTVAAEFNATDACIGGMLGSSIRFMSAHVVHHNMPTCQNLTAVQPLPKEQDGEEALCNLDITFMSMVPFGAKVLRVTMKGAIPETEELARLHRFESKQLTGFCVGEHLRVTPDSSTRPLVQLRVDQPLGREKHVPHARRTKTIPIHDCRPLVAPKPLQFVQSFSAGKLELNYGRPGPHRSVGSPQVYTVNVHLGALFAPLSKSISIDRQVLCPVCQGSGARHASKLHTCHACNGTGMATQSHALCTGQDPTAAVDEFLFDEEEDGGVDADRNNHRASKGRRHHRRHRRAHAYPGKYHCPVQHVSKTCPTCAGHGKVVQYAEECSRCGGARTVRVKENVQLAYPAGAEDGTPCTFDGKGNEDPFMTAGSLTFVVKTTNHDGFHREGQNIVSVMNLTLADALAGIDTQVRHLNGSMVPLKVPGVIAPGTNATIAGAGLPFNDEEPNARCGAHPASPPLPDNTVYGDWVVMLNITFPERRKLNRTERRRLGSAFRRRKFGMNSARGGSSCSHAGGEWGGGDCDEEVRVDP